MYFENVENLHELEQNEQWEVIRKSLYEQWLGQKDNLGILVRLALECWLVMSDWDCCINNEGLNYELFKSNLMDSYVYGLAHFGDNEKFLCLFGYMMSLFPYFFYLNNDKNSEKYLIYENKGKSMLEKAYRNFSNNPLAKVLFLGSIDQTKECDKAKMRLKLSLSSLFPGDTAIEKYFKEILSN